MEVPTGYTESTDEMKREYLVGNKTSEEIAGAIRALLDCDTADYESPQLNKQEKAEVYIILQEIRG